MLPVNYANQNGVSMADHPLQLIAEKLHSTDAVSNVEAVPRAGSRVTVAGVQQA